MSEGLEAKDLERMLRGAACRVKEAHEELSKLDSAGGDGDHGTTMLRVVEALEKALSETVLSESASPPAPGSVASPPVLGSVASPSAPGEILRRVAWAVLGVDGGATGPLFGSLFLGMSEVAGAASSLSAADFAAALSAGRRSVEKRTRAKPGDKTMMDALVPAAEAGEAAAREGLGLAEVLERASSAAEAGAESTRDLTARFGRARNVGAKTIGVRDPGAVSVSLILKGLQEGFESHG